MKSTFFTYKDDDCYCCERCMWEAQTPVIEYGRLSEKYSLYNVSCPQCKRFIGYWLAPIISFLLPSDIQERKRIIAGRLCGALISIIMHKKRSDAFESKIEIKPTKKNNKPVQLKFKF